jgi:hypothetical protein
MSSSVTTFTPYLPLFFCKLWDCLFFTKSFSLSIGLMVIIYFISLSQRSLFLLWERRG